MIGPISRILLRVLSGYLLAGGFTATDFSDDPDAALLIEQALGAIIWGATEGYYYLAKRYGWST
jgi:hypothetical protein